MARLTSIRRTCVFAFLAAAATAAACGGGSDDGGGGSPIGPSPGPSGPSATVVITATGVTQAVDISPGQRVEFFNNDSRVHEFYTTPHELHTDCPAINSVAVLQPGERKMTGELAATRICGFHDHRDPTNNAFRGVIRVGTTTGPAPEY
jgi:hypothetical protein